MTAKDIPSSKVCSKCGSRKPAHDFYRAEGMRDGRRNECPRCMHLARHRHYEANREKYIRKAQEWKRKNPERYARSQRRRRERRDQARMRLERDQYLQRTYGLTLLDFEFLVVSQKGECAICGKRDGEKLHVDHDHATGCIRGLLCGSCNRAMGLFHEDAARFKAAGEYLRTPQLPLAAGDRQKRPSRRVRRPAPKTSSDSS